MPCQRLLECVDLPAVGGGEETAVGQGEAVHNALDRQGSQEGSVGGLETADFISSPDVENSAAQDKSLRFPHGLHPGTAARGLDCLANHVVAGRAVHQDAVSARVARNVGPRNCVALLKVEGPALGPGVVAVAGSVDEFAVRANAGVSEAQWIGLYYTR